jgi:hypothetical protein
MFSEHLIILKGFVVGWYLIHDCLKGGFLMLIIFVTIWVI